MANRIEAKRRLGGASRLSMEKGLPPMKALIPAAGLGTRFLPSMIMSTYTRMATHKRTYAPMMNGMDGATVLYISTRTGFMSIYLPLHAFTAS